MAIPTTPVTWEPAGSEITLPANAGVLVFKIDVQPYFTRITGRYEQVLTQEEVDRSVRFLREADRQRFITSRFFLRTTLAQLTGTSAQQIQFEYNANGKPFVTGIEFNVAHSGNCVLVALSTLPVGIDTEQVAENFDHNALLAISFDEPEIAYIKNNIDFYTLWTRKEALLKITGEGLTDDLPAINCLPDQVERCGKNYNLYSFRADDGHMASLATATGAGTLHFYHVT